MNNNQYRYEEIEAYLSGTLQESAQAAFTARLEEDRTLAKEVRLHREIAQVLGDKQALEMSALLQSVLHPKQGRSARFIPLFYRMAVAAVFLVSMTVALFLLRPPQAQRLYSQYHQTYPLFLVERSATAAGQNTLETAVHAYEAGQYQTAATSFEALRQMEPEHAGYQFYAAICRLENKEPDIAIQQLEAFLQGPTNQYTETARWYLALAYLKTKQPEKAKTALQQLKESGGDYTDTAADLMEKLR